MSAGGGLTETKIIVGRDISWRKDFSVMDLIRDLDDKRPMVGVVVNGTYGAKSRFSDIKIPDRAKVELIPWREGMTIRELLEHDIDETFFFAATIDGLLVPEGRFDTCVIPEGAEVWPLTFVGGG